MISSPPGQFDSVLADVKKLLPDGLLTAPMLSGIAKAYNERNGSIVAVEGGENIVVCKEGEIDPTKYVDTNTKKVVKVDHVQRTGRVDPAKPLPPNTFDSSLEDKRAAIQKAVNDYLKKHYSGGIACAGVYSKDKNIQIVVSGEKLNLKNYWSGSWVSRWTLAGSGELSGSAKIIAHYFEEGNVQLNTSKEFPSQNISGATSEEFGRNVAARIKECEEVLQMGLLQMYGNMSDETLKSMRRVLPITRSKMEWNAAAHKMTKQLQQPK